MSEKPILFSAPMVRAILEGRKTQTRRIIKPNLIPTDWDKNDKNYQPTFEDQYGDHHEVRKFCPYGQAGDTLYVRESARVINVRGGWREIDVEYQADKLFATVKYPARLAPAPLGKLLPNGTHKEASRIRLEIVDIRAERLQDISESDAEAEGVERNCIKCDSVCPQYPNKDKCPDAGTYINYLHNEDDFPAFSARESFESLWESINGAESWNSNPWVWVVEFKKMEASK